MKFKVYIIILAAFIASVPALVFRVSASDDLTEKMREPFHYDAKGKRDPFVSLVIGGKIIGSGETRPVSDKPVLYGIVWDEGGSSIALIDDLEAKTGDAVGAYQVEEIRKDSVVLRNGEEALVLQITFEEAASSKESPPATTRGDEP